MKAVKRRWAAWLIALVLAVSVVSAAADYKYVGSAKSNKYHYPTCTWARRIKPQNLVVFRSAGEAQEKGYVPCKVCKPPLQD